MTPKDHPAAASVAEEPETLPFWTKLAYFLMIAGMAIPVLTGVVTFLLGQAPMSQWVLMLHVGASPLFSAGLALLAIAWSANRAPVDYPTRLVLWSVLVIGIVVVLSGVVPMTPVFGTEGQHALYLLHRWSAVLLTALVGLHLWRLRAGR